MNTGWADFFCRFPRPKAHTPSHDQLQPGFLAGALVDPVRKRRALARLLCVACLLIRAKT